MTKPRIAVIGANEFQDPLIRKAKDMGFETHVFAWACGDVGEKSADCFHPVSIVEKDTILDICRTLGVVAVASIGSDLAVGTVNHIARAMGFPANPLRCDTVATDKFEMRRALFSAGIPVPRFVRAAADSPAEAFDALRCPLIVKPVDRSGSRAVTRVDTPEGILPAVRAATDASFSGQAIAEEFITGDEYSGECISFEGRHHLLALTKKHTTGAPHFIETGHDEPADIPAAQIPSVRAEIFRALDALDIRYGASHTEFRVQEGGGIRIIEIGARMGGDCIGSDLVMLSTGCDFVRMVIDAACGRAPDLTPGTAPRRAHVRFIFNESDLAALEALKRERPDALWRTGGLKPIQPGGVGDSSQRFGYYIWTEPMEREVF